MPCGQIPANRLNERKSQTDIASRPLPKSPVSSSQYDVVPQMIIQSPNVRPGEFAIGDAKRLLQQYHPMNSHHQLEQARPKSVNSDIATPHSMISSAITSSVFGTARPS